jgi:hypothetical protein
MRYLLVQYLRQPDPSGKGTNGQIDEQVTYAKRIKEGDLQTMNVILDYKTEKVVKCVIEGKVVPTTFENMDAYYGEIYPSLITQLKSIQKSESKAAE